MFLYVITAILTEYTHTYTNKKAYTPTTKLRLLPSINLPNQLTKQRKLWSLTQKQRKQVNSKNWKQMQSYNKLQKVLN